jgi:uncharacterized membrane protein
MSLYLFALLIGVIAGLRAMTGSGRRRLGRASGLAAAGGLSAGLAGRHRSRLDVDRAAGMLELVGDQLPKTPSRKVPVQFITRVLAGAFSGAALMMPSSHWLRGAVIGAVGAVIGTLGGAEVRGRLAKLFGKDRPPPSSRTRSRSAGLPDRGPGGALT